MTLSRISNVIKTDFFKSLSVLLSGTLIAQAIGYIIAPILTRLYSTGEMGELALYMRITGFIAAIATFRYELALPLPKNDGHSYLLFRISLIIAIFILILSSFLLIGLAFSGLTPGFEWWYILLIILGSAFIVIINIGTNWSIRTGTFKLISQQKIYNSLFSNGLKWIFAFLSWGYFGLILSTFIGHLVSSFAFVLNFKKLKKQFKHLRSKKKTLVLMREHREFPLLNLPHVLVDHGRDMLVATLIFTFFSDSIYGSFSHSYNMLRIPIMLIGISLSQVFYNEAAKLYKNQKPLMPILKKTTLLLAGISVVPFTLLFLFGEPIFSLVFGAEWSSAGRYSEIMAFWLMVNFVLSPISALPLIISKQRISFVLGLISALIQVMPLWIIPMIYGKNEDVFLLSLQVISYLQAFWLLISLGAYFQFVRKNDRQLLHKNVGE
jgi:teichuronic acid exporter